MNAILVGYGLSGQIFHAPLLKAAGIHISDVVVNDSERRVLAATNIPNVKIHENLTQALFQSNAQLVVLATPTDTHSPLSIEALQAGRHVVVDKPIALSMHELEGMIRVADDAQRYLIPFQNRRWDADFLTLKGLINHNKLGEVVRYEARFDRFNPMVKDRWREHNIDGGGMLYDLGPHLIDQAVQLFGAPDWVFCTLLSQRVGAKTNDGFELILGWHQNNSLYVSLGASQFSAAADQAYGAPRYKVQGRKATWFKSGFDPQEAALRSGVSPNIIGWLTESDEARGILIDGGTALSVRTEAGVGEWPFFYDAVRKAIEFNQAPPILVTELLMTCAIIDAARVSAQTNQRINIKKSLLSRSV